MTDQKNSEVMSDKGTPKRFFLAAVLLVLLFASCSPLDVDADSEPTEIGMIDNDLPVSSPELARDRALDHLRISYPGSLPVADARWQEENITSEAAVATRNFLYSFRNWTVSVVSPQIMPERRVYMVIVQNDAVDFQWAGLIDAYGRIMQMRRLQVTSTPPPPTLTMVPTITTLPTFTPVPSTTMTPSPVACNDASFLDDVTIPDGTEFTPGTQFLKVWRLRNVGTCTWTTDYDLVFVGGSRMGAQRAVPLAETVRPGESAELGVYMFAPAAQGSYQGFWMLRNASGMQFGVGDDADDSFWVNIDVVGIATDFKHDFASNYCAAIWRSAAGRLSCGDSTIPQNGFVQFLASPNLESRHENEPTLWVHPNHSRNGWIEGSYPPITIESGDSFRAWVGCLQGNELCDLTFYLSYMDENDRVYTLRRWHEVYENQVTTIDLDLSNLEGQAVQFILGVETNTEEFGDQQGFWFVPRIEGE